MTRYPVYRKLGWDPVPDWTSAENLARAGIRSRDRLARSELLYRLSHPGPLTEITDFTNYSYLLNFLLLYKNSLKILYKENSCILLKMFILPPPAQCHLCHRWPLSTKTAMTVGNVRKADRQQLTVNVGIPSSYQLERFRQMYKSWNSSKVKGTLGAREYRNERKSLVVLTLNPCRQDDTERFPYGRQDVVVQDLNGHQHLEYIQMCLSFANVSMATHIHGNRLTVDG